MVDYVDLFIEVQSQMEIQVGVIGVSWELKLWMW